MAFHRWLLLFGFVAALALVVGCGGGKTVGGDPPSSQPDGTIDAFLARYVLATKERDAETLASMYTEPSEWTDPTGTRTYTRAEVKAMFETTFAIVTVVYDSYMKDLNVTVSGDMAVVQFVGVQDVYNSILDQRTVTELPTTWSLRKIGGAWYIAESNT